jgi:hemolysin activation/secretion protein
VNQSFHSDVSRLFAFDLKTHFAFASEKTPVFEMPTLGAPEIIRGFRRDDVIGSRLWALQPEVWLPVRAVVPFMFDPVAHTSNKLSKFVREGISIAAFSDVGGVYKTVTSSPGTRYGPGAGLRFQFSRQAILRLDWAHGFGDGVTGKGRNRFYFTFDLLENPL